MQTIHVLEKTGKDGMLSLRIPLGKPEAEYEVLVVVQPRNGATNPEEDLPAPNPNPWAAINALREELARSGREFPDSTPLIREDRER
jgi:hypothetical protein